MMADGLPAKRELASPLYTRSGRYTAVHPGRTHASFPHVSWAMDLPGEPRGLDGAAGRESGHAPVQCNAWYFTLIRAGQSARGRAARAS